jgi:hypothetical protein
MGKSITPAASCAAEEKPGILAIYKDVVLYGIV